LKIFLFFLELCINPVDKLKRKKTEPSKKPKGAAQSHNNKENFQ